VSPEAPATATSTLFSAVALLDLSSGTEVRSPYAPFVFGPALGLGPSRMAGLVDVDIYPDPSSVYVLAQGANRVARLAIRSLGFEPVPIDGGVDALATLGNCSYPTLSCGGPDAGPDGGSGPMGVPLSVSAFGDSFAVNDWTSRALLGVAPGVQFNQPYGPTVAPGSSEERQLIARRLFYTAVDRWSRNEVGSCASCHPDGLSDNVTWMFSAGPRQTPALDGTFASADPSDHRVQNWTGNFDEVYDVEGVVRNVLGGIGALVIGTPDGGPDNVISLSHGIALDGVTTRNDNLSGSTHTVDTEVSTLHDWGLIEKFIQGIATNAAPVYGASASDIGAGRALFQLGGCHTCHGGPKWTVSHVPYAPSPVKNGSLVGDNGLPAAPTGLRVELRDGGTLPLNHDIYKVAVETVPNPDGGPMLSVGPERITCVLRDVGTYDPMSPLEHKSDGTPSQGALGFNPPSLLGVGTSAPYFHDGSAKTLADVLAQQKHLQAGTQTFSLSPAQVAQLAAFLASIDEGTMPIAVPPFADVCGGY
jgi:cytochrome c peroxidase